MRFGRSPKVNAPRVKVARMIKIRRSDPASRTKMLIEPSSQAGLPELASTAFANGDFAMNKRPSILLSITALTGFIAAVALSSPAPVWAQGQKVLKFIPQADLRILD